MTFSFSCDIIDNVRRGKGQSGDTASADILENLIFGGIIMTIKNILNAFVKAMATIDIDVIYELYSTHSGHYDGYVEIPALRVSLYYNGEIAVNGYLYGYEECTEQSEENAGLNLYELITNEMEAHGLVFKSEIEGVKKSMLQSKATADGIIFHDDLFDSLFTAEELAECREKSRAEAHRAYKMFKTWLERLRACKVVAD